MQHATFEIPSLAFLAYFAFPKTTYHKAINLALKCAKGSTSCDHLIYVIALYATKKVIWKK